jgi:hypothetical protein
VFGVTLTLALVVLGLCLAARRGLARVYERHPLAACVLMMAGAPTRDASQNFQTANDEHRVTMGTYHVGPNNANVRSQRFVKRDGDDGKVTVTAAGDLPIGYLTHGQVDDSTPSTWGPGEVKTGEDFATDDKVKVERGQGWMVPVTIEDSTGTVNAGDALTTAANGKVKGADALSVAVPNGTTNVQSTSAQPDLTESGGLPPQPIVAYANETADPGGGDVEIMAVLAI